MILSLINVGINEKLDSSEKRRVKLINIFALIAFFLIVLFGAANLLSAFFLQSAIVFSGLILTVFPPFLLNKNGKYLAARHYFTISCLVLISVATLYSIQLGQNRMNEMMMLGFSVFIVVIFDGRYRYLYFIGCCLLTLAFVIARASYEEPTFNNDLYMSFVNVISGFILIYFFTSMYKKELSESNKLLEKQSEVLKEKQNEVAKNHDRIAYTKLLLRSAIDSLPVYIALLDLEGKYLIANSRYEETFGLPVNKIEGRHYSEVLPPQISQLHERYINLGLVGKPCDFNDPVKMPDGSVIQSLGRYIPVFDEEGKQFALAVYVIDITSLKETEAKLLELNDEKNKILGLISHDLRAPLSSLKGLLNIAGQIEESEIKGFINQVEEKLSVVSYSLDNLLNWAKLQMKGLNISPKAVSLTECLRQSESLFEDYLKNKKISILVENGSEDSFAYVDEECLNLVIRNIISNAIKFSPPRKKIKVNIENMGDTIRLTITDSGKGIDPSYIEQLKNGVSSVESSEGTFGEKGTGLGLPLSFDLMKNNGGQLDIHSELSKGTAVSLIMPKAN